MLKSSLTLSLLVLAINGDILTKESVKKHLDVIEKTLYTAEKTCWSEKEEKAADMVAREVKKQFLQIKSLLLSQEGDLSLVWYNTINELCETADNITTEATSDWSGYRILSLSHEYCSTGTNDQEMPRYGLTSEEVIEWMNVLGYQAEAMVPFIKPVFDASHIAKIQSINLTGEAVQQCKNSIVNDFVTSQSDIAVSEYNFIVKSIKELNLGNVGNSTISNEDRKELLRLRMTSLAGLPCLFVSRFLGGKIRALDGMVKHCAEERIH